MSTILKALEEIERNRPGQARPLPPPGNERRRWPLVAAGVLLVAATSSMFLLLRSPTSPRATETEERPGSRLAASVPAAPEPAANVPRRPAAAVSAPQKTVPQAAVRPADLPAPAEEAPRGRVVRRRASKPAPKPAPARVAAKPALPPLAPVAIPRERGEVQDSPLPGAPAGGQMGVALQSIRYSKDANKRLATIDIQGTGVVTLGEGESAGGVEVQLILSDVVYVYRDGMVFGLSPTR